MAPQGLKVSVRLHVNQVTCPGVCLSSRSDLILRVWLLGETLRTSPAPPSFPLRFNRTFNVSQVFDANDLCTLHAQLAAEGVRAELAEASPGLRPLASFHCSLLTLLFPSPSSAPTVLHMQPLRNFPGVLGPELEVRTWTCVQQIDFPHSMSSLHHRKVSSIEPAEWRSLSEVRSCSRQAHKYSNPSPSSSCRPPFVVRHVDPNIFKYTPNTSRSPSRSKRMSAEPNYNASYDCSPKACDCNVCGLYEEYFGSPYPQHFSRDDDEGVADMMQPRSCCCCCPQLMGDQGAFNT